MSQLRQQGLMRFDFLDGALPGRVNPTDIDQVLERFGNFLFIECKRPGQTINGGQRYLFDALCAGPRSVRVLIVEGHPPADITGFGLYRQPLVAATVAEARTYVRAWWDAMSAQGRAA